MICLSCDSTNVESYIDENMLEYCVCGDCYSEFITAQQIRDNEGRRRALTNDQEMAFISSIN